MSHLMTVTNPDPKLPNSDHLTIFCIKTRQRFRTNANLLLRVGSVFLKVPSHNMDVAGKGFQVVKGLLGAEVARAEDVLDPARHQQLLELGWQG